MSAAPVPGARMVAFASLDLDDAVFPREQLDQVRIAEIFEPKYREGGAGAFDPLAAVEAPDGRLLVYDGWHRCEGAKRAGLSELPVYVVAPLPGQDVRELAYRLAVERAVGGALQLTAKERRQAIMRIKRANPGISDSELARSVGVSRATVAKTLEGAHVELWKEGGRKYGPEESAREAARKIVGGLVHARRRGVLDRRGLAARMPELIADALDDAFGEQAAEYAELLADWAAEAADQYPDDPLEEAKG